MPSIHSEHRRGQQPSKRRAFTLIELLVVISIISILAAILFPVFARARENARRTSCLSNVRQIGLSFQQYFQDYDEQFPIVKPADNIKWPHGGMQPYLKSKQILQCPNDTDDPAWSRPVTEAGDGYLPTRVTSYTLNGFFQHTPGTESYEVFIGSHIARVQSAAEVVMLAETANDPSGTPAGLAGNQYVSGLDYFHAHKWPIPPATSGPRWNEEKNRPSDLETQRHLEGFNVVYLDGHAKWGKWEQLYKITPSDDPALPIKGNFDPRR